MGKGEVKRRREKRVRITEEEGEEKEQRKGGRLNKLGKRMRTDRERRMKWRERVIIRRKR